MSQDGIVQAAAEALARGQVVGVPTDTVYGLAADPWSEGAVEALYALKGRPERKPIGLLVASAEQAEEIADLGPGRPLAHHWPGALTLVVRPRVLIPDWIGHRALGTVGIRVPDHGLLRRLLQATGPLAVTSANRSGEPDMLDDEAARPEFGSGVAVYLPGQSPGGVASTVVDATGERVRLLRAGPIVIAEDA